MTNYLQISTFVKTTQQNSEIHFSKKGRVVSKKRNLKKILQLKGLWKAVKFVGLSKNFSTVQASNVKDSNYAKFD